MRAALTEAENALETAAKVAPTNRRGLRDAMGAPPPGMTNPQAQHDLPWALREWFAKHGLNVNDPWFGRWIEGTPPGGHQRWTREFQNEWEDFIRKKGDGATREEILEFMERLRGDPRFQ